MTKITISCICLLFFNIAFAASEKILLFESNITIQPDGKVLITENITVQATGNKIKRGIYRDIPLSKVWLKDSVKKTPVKLLKVLRNGNSTSYHTDIKEKNLRVYIGKKHTHIRPGIY